MSQKESPSSPSHVEIITFLLFGLVLVWVMAPHLIDIVRSQVAARIESVRGDLLLFCRVAITLTGAWAGAWGAAWLGRRERLRSILTRAASRTSEEVSEEPVVR